MHTCAYSTYVYVFRLMLYDTVRNVDTFLIKTRDGSPGVGTFDIPPSLNRRTSSRPDVCPSRVCPFLMVTPAPSGEGGAFSLFFSCTLTACCALDTELMSDTVIRCRVSLQETG